MEMVLRENWWALHIVVMSNSPISSIEIPHDTSWGIHIKTMKKQTTLSLISAIT
jgi:hypothetical protein